jgi:hypothetical protein
MKSLRLKLSVSCVLYFLSNFRVYCFYSHLCTLRMVTAQPTCRLDQKFRYAFSISPFLQTNLENQHQEISVSLSMIWWSVFARAQTPQQFKTCGWSTIPGVLAGMEAATHRASIDTNNIMNSQCREWHGKFLTSNIHSVFIIGFRPLASGWKLEYWGRKRSQPWHSYRRVPRSGRPC